MGRLEDLRKWWRERPENSDNWDLERWNFEHTRFLRLGWVYMIFFGALGLIQTWFVYYYPSAYTFPFFSLMFFFGVVFALVDYYYIRSIRKLEEGDQ